MKRSRFHWCGVAGLTLALHGVVGAQVLPLPERPADAPTGTAFVQHIEAMEPSAREHAIAREIFSGNVPDFLRRLSPVNIIHVADGLTNQATLHVTPDYLAVGSDEDYFLAPLSPTTAQRLADELECILPTRKIVNAIYTAANVKLEPSPIPPSSAMTTVPVFAEHNALVKTQRAASLAAHPPGALIAGHKKDVVISAKLATATNKVAIYGWHRINGEPIQPLYTGHTSAWVDYSHGIRLVHQSLTVNGQSTTVTNVLADPNLAPLLSDEGVLTHPRYPTDIAHRASPPTNAAPAAVSRNVSVGFSGFRNSPFFSERVATFTVAPEVTIHINAPPAESFARDKTALLIFYALPNGNTLEQTVGKVLRAGDDWRFDIQHIGAQTRFLRQRLTGCAVVIAYFENDSKSWPAWRRKHGDARIVSLMEYVKRIFADYPLEIALNGHSGGGSFIFGYINALEAIPDDVVRIGFLDSNYAYDAGAGHADKLARWLRGGSLRHLCVLAYHDSVALLDGKPFVSASGGTWGRSHAMLEDLGALFEFTSQTNGLFRNHFALDRRVQFLLRENPEKKIYHTVQVERNGFIHSIVCGTTNEGKGYEYFGARAYSQWIQDE